MQTVLKIAEYLTITVPIICLTGTIAGLYYFRYLKKEQKILFYLLIYSILNETFSYILAKTTGSNLIFISIYGIVEFVLIYYYLYLQSDKISKKIALFILPILFFNIYEFYKIDYLNFELFQTYSKSVNSIFLLITVIIIIIQKLKNDTFDLSNKLFLALPCFLAINAILFLPINILINFMDIRVFIVWIINTINIAVFFLIITLHLWKFGRIQKI